MVNRYTADRRVRRDDAYTPEGVGGLRPDRSVIVYSQRVREAFADAAIVIGGIEASLRRIAHYDYWQEKVRRSILLDTQRRPPRVRQRRASDRRDRAPARGGREPHRHQERARHRVSRHGGRRRLDGDRFDASGFARALRPSTPILTPWSREIAAASREAAAKEPGVNVVRFTRKVPTADRDKSYIRLPSYEQVRDDPVLYAHASRILHMESNPGNARALVQRHGANDVWLNAPPVPLTSEEMDGIYELPYARRRIRPTATRRSPPTK